MADTQTALKRRGLTRGKAILIGVLVLVLVGVLYLQLGGGGGDAVAHVSRRPARTPAAGASKAAAATTSMNSENRAQPAVATIVDEQRWKSPNLAEVVDYDPFALPAAFPKPRVNEPADGKTDGLVAAAAADAKKLADAVAELQMQLRTLMEEKVQVIVRERDQYVAMIGDRTVHVGDEIGEFTVTAIDQSGVRVERKTAP